MAEHAARIGARLRQLARVLRHGVDEAVAVGELLKGSWVDRTNPAYGPRPLSLTVLRDF